jgi:hypothetical protein
MKSHLDIGHVAIYPKTPVVDESAFNWHRLERVLWRGPRGITTQDAKATGERVTIFAVLFANHAGNKVTRCSHTGIIIYAQNAPILWYSKRQNTVEAATFRSEMVALRICKELIVAISYKLRVFGVEIGGPANVFCDNRGVVKNVSIPESTLMKKHNAINYHAVREAVGAGILRVGKEDGGTNLADLLTKVITGQKRWDFCYCLFC